MKSSVTFEQFLRLDLEHIRKLFDRVERGGIYLALERRNIGSINPGEICQRFLRQFAVGSNATQVGSKDLPQVHATNVALAWTLHPRSILYKNCRGRLLMRTVNLLGRCTLATVLALSACTRQPSIDQDQHDVNLTSYNAADSADQSAAADTGADQSGDPVTMNSWDFDGSAAAPPAEHTSGDVSTSAHDAADDQPDELWIGAVGGAADQKCTKTTGGHIGTTPYIPVQNGQATILSESDQSVVLWTRRVDTGKDMKTVFGASQAFCEEARKRAQREPFPQQ